MTIALGFECLLLAALAGDRSSMLVGRVTLAALAMGIQSAAARRLDVFGIATTFVTGTLTSLVSLIARHGMGPTATGHGKRLLATAWVVYVVGAMAAGGAMRDRARRRAAGAGGGRPRRGGHRRPAILAHVTRRLL